MDEPLKTKIAWLQRQATEIANDRRQTWQCIKRDYPDHAEFLSTISDVFGKPKSVTMIDERTGERIL